MKPYLRFGIGTLLFAFLLAAGYFAGYRSGYDHGAAQYRADQMTIKQYGIADLVTIHPKSKEVNFVESTIRETTGDRNSWSDWGGKGFITFNKGSVALIISQTDATHHEIQGFLQALRLARSLNDPHKDIVRSDTLRTSVQFDVADLIATKDNPGINAGSLAAAVEQVAPQAEFVHVTPEGTLTFHGTLIDHLRAKDFLEGLRKISYHAAHEIVQGPDGTLYKHDRTDGRLWIKRGEDDWALQETPSSRQDLEPPATPQP